MKRTTILVVIGTNDPGWDELREEFKPYTMKEFKEYLNWGGLQLPFVPDSPELLEACKRAEALGEKPALFSQVRYTKKELDNLPFFCLMPHAPLELEGTNAEFYGTKYQGGCPCCGRGKKPVGNVLVDRKFLRKCPFGELNGEEYFVHRNVKEIIELNNLTGIRFGSKLKDYKGREMDDFYLIDIHSVLPPMSPSSWFKERPQELECGHNILYVRSDYQYETEKMVNALDFNLTSEYINNNSARQLIVSAKVRRVFKENNIRMRFDPVTLI